MLNNVIGTLNALEYCDEFEVDEFVLISTDKAVTPTSVMGASKRVAEFLTQSFAGQTETRCITVRFGNVIGSNGSVVPLFQKQIAYGSNNFPFKSPLYKGTVDYSKGLCPVAERMHEKEFFSHELMLPGMSKEDLDDVATAFMKVWENLDELKE